MWVVIHYDAIMLQRYKNFSFNPINCKKKDTFSFRIVAYKCKAAILRLFICGKYYGSVLFAVKYQYEHVWWINARPVLLFPGFANDLERRFVTVEH